MSILVIGGTGMVGGHVVRGLLTKGEAVRVLTRSAYHGDFLQSDDPPHSEGLFVLTENTHRSPADLP